MVDRCHLSVLCGGHNLLFVNEVVTCRCHLSVLCGGHNLLFVFVNEVDVTCQSCVEVTTCRCYLPVLCGGHNLHFVNEVDVTCLVWRSQPVDVTCVHALNLVVLIDW